MPDVLLQGGIIMDDTPTQALPKSCCPGFKKTGAPCSATPGRSGWCPWHDPSRTDAERLGWVRKGGLAGRPTVQPGAPDPRWGSPEDVQRYLEENAGMVTRGELSPEVARERRQSAEAWMRVWESRHLRDQLEALEQLVGQKLQRRWG